MALSKESLYGNTLRKAARFTKATSHPARIFILAQLMDGPLDVAVMKEDHPLAQATFSQHLRILRMANLVKCESHGMNCVYELIHSNHPNWLRQLLRSVKLDQSFSQAA